MNRSEALSFISEKIALNPIQRAIFEGAWEKQTYRYMSRRLGISTASIKQQAYLLWKDLSKILGVKIKKNNLSSVFSVTTRISDIS